MNNKEYCVDCGIRVVPICVTSKATEFYADEEQAKQLSFMLTKSK